MATNASKHAAAPKPERSLTSRVLTRLLAVILVFGLLVAGAVLVLSNLGSKQSSDQTPTAAQPSCEAHTLHLAADPAIADAVSAATADLACLAVEVDARSSAEAAAELSGPAGSATDLPDAWLPDASAWLDVARRTEDGAKRLGQTPESIATSPLVIAVNAEKAAAEGWPTTQPNWETLMAAPTSKWSLGIPDPAESTAGLATVMSVGRQSEEIATLGRRLELPSTAETSPAQIVADGDLDAMPTAEYDVARVAEAGGDVVASYDSALGGALDFPLIGITPDSAIVSDQVAADFELLKEALVAPSTQEVLSATGLRSVDGVLAPKYVSADGAPVNGVIADETAAPLSVRPKRVKDALATWSLVGRRSRLLVLLDVSGSMEQTLPGGEKRKIDLARNSLQELIDASAPDSDLGLWTFTTGGAADGTKRIVDVGALSDDIGGQTRRDRLSEVVDGLEPVPGGGTPLHRAVLAAYASALDDYADGRYNAVVVVTDGKDEDDTQTPIPADQMLDQLRRQFDESHPVEIIGLAYGADVDFDVLRQMADVTGGAAYQGLTQKKVTKMLSDALAAS